MKIAIVTSDGNSVSQHFGRSPYYKIISIDNNKVTGEEMRQRRTGHFAPQQKQAEHHQNNNHDHGGHGEKHGYGSDADTKHASMATEIGDCQILVAGGMGQGAYESFKRAGLDVVMTNRQLIEDVIIDYINGNLVNYAYDRTD
ncbi:MAG: dinitrogenase iron-molybdenum cofactor biosynthesis protein [Chlorobi bacterium]|nr:dinitrogenase iron-molybdenum cofactor biosynthesis protein [Chlorobiota bacterium]